MRFVESTEVKGLSGTEYRKHAAISQSDLKAAHKAPQMYHETSQGKWSGDRDSKSFLFGIELEEYVRQGAHAYHLIPQEVLAKNGARSGKKYNDYLAEHELDKNDPLVVTEKEFLKKGGAMLSAAQNIRDHSLAYHLCYQEGMKWHPHIFWKEEETGLEMKAELDIWHPGANIIVDIKTARSANVEAFTRQAWELGYHIQAAVYTEAVMALTGESCEFYFVVVHNEPPYEVEVVCFDEEARALAREEANDLIHEFDYRQSSNFWTTKTHGDVYEMGVPKWRKK